MSSCANPKCKAGGETTGTKQCSRCEGAGYCSKECQTGDWKRHKRECKRELEWFASSDALLLAEVKGMGAGIYARRELAPGELLWEETAVIETDAPMTDAAARTIQTQYAALPTDKKAQVDTLYDRNRLDGARKPGDPSDINILSIFDTNSTQWNTAAALIGPGDEGSGKVPKDVLSMYLIVARMNHACTPNTALTHMPSGAVQVRTACVVAKGAEVTTNYVPLDAPTELRMKQLMTSWSFRCACATCLAGNKESDQRRMHIGLLMGPTDKRSSIEHLIALDNTIPAWLAAMIAFTKASDVVLFAAEERLHTWERAGWYKLYQMALLIGQVKLATNALKSYQAISATLLGPEHPHVKAAAAWDPKTNPRFAQRHQATPGAVYNRHRVHQGLKSDDHPLAQLATAMTASLRNELPFCGCAGLCGLRCSTTTRPTLLRVDDILHDTGSIARFYAEDPSFEKVGKVEQLYADRNVADRLLGATAVKMAQAPGGAKPQAQALKLIDLEAGTALLGDSSDPVPLSDVAVLPFQCGNCGTTYCTDSCFKRDLQRHAGLCSLFRKEGALTMRERTRDAGATAATVQKATISQAPQVPPGLAKQSADDEAPAAPAAPPVTPAARAPTAPAQKPSANKTVKVETLTDDPDMMGPDVD